MRRTLPAIAVLIVGVLPTLRAISANEASMASTCTIPPRVVGPDGIPGTGDDGILTENFDTERDGTPGISLASQPLGTPGVLNDTIGVWVGTAPGGVTTLSGIGCAGFQVPPQDPECRIDPDHDMDWHIHCPPGTCPNVAGHATPLDGAMAASGQNSLHWGHHFDPDSRDGDSTRVRQLAAFTTNPIHLTPEPRSGDLELSFFHIADMMDNNSYGLPVHMANDYGDVQIQVLDPHAPGGSLWGFWDKLLPFQNVYDHIAYAWSAFGTSPTYCLLTPTDTGPGSYAPRGAKETLCFPDGVWSHCGNSRDSFGTGNCSGPGVPGSAGVGLWVQSRFSLDAHLGQTVRIRWIAQSWEFDCCTSSYYELGGGWAPQTGDEGWWVDDIRVTGALQAPAQIPGAVETCNGLDDDCDGRVDEAPSCPDPDFDGVQGPSDNCPVVANSDQGDFDQDGVGDVCDLDDGLILIMVPAPGTVTWQPEAGYESFDVFSDYHSVRYVRGTRATLPAKHCAWPCTTGRPPPGEAIFYFVAGRLGIASSPGTDPDRAGGPGRSAHPCP